MLVVEFSINPLDQGTSVAVPVSRAVDLIDRSGLSYEVGAIGTTIEGGLDEIMELLKNCIQEASQGSDRVSFTIHGDLRPGEHNRLQKNIKRVEETLGRQVRN